MRMDIFASRHSNTRAENRILKFFVILIGCIQIVNMVWNYTITGSSRTIIIPAGLDAKMEITDKSISEEAVRQYTRYAFALAFNYNVSTARQQFDELLTWYTPDSFVKAKTNLYSLAEDVENAKVSSSFYIQKMTLDQREGSVEVQGTKRQYTNEVKVEDTTKIYILEYRIVGGRFMIEKLREKAGAAS